MLALLSVLTYSALLFVKSINHVVSSVHLSDLKGNI